MTSTPKETTTTTEPWDGSKGYLLQNYADYNNLIQSGAPQAYTGNTIADLSNATQQAQQGQTNYYTNPENSNILSNAQSAVNGITSGSAIDQTGNNVLKSLTNGVSYGSDPTYGAYGSYANGSQLNAGPGNSTLNAAQNYSNPGIGATQSALQGVNQNYSNPALAQASNLGNYTNAAGTLQTNQANSLASASNPANANLAATASGANIGNNPYLAQSVNNATQTIADQLGKVTLPTLQGQSAMMGRLGSNASASLYNDATSTAANAMSKAATDMYANQYNTDTTNMLNANQQVAQNYNNDVGNALNANSALSSTLNNQQSQSLAGTQLYGNLADSQQTQRNNATSQLLSGAGQIGSLSDSAQTLRNNAANSLNSQYNSNVANQLSALGSQSGIYNNSVTNAFNNAGVKSGAASALNSNQNTQYGTQLTGAGMAADQYNNGTLPYTGLAGVGTTQDTRAQDTLNQQIALWNQQQQQPLTNIANFTNLLNGGGYTSTTTPVYSNTGAQVLGGLTSILGLL